MECGILYEQNIWPNTCMVILLSALDIGVLVHNQGFQMQ